MTNLQDKQQEAYNLMRSGISLLLTGSAGTGKSVCIKAFMDTCEDRKIALTSTTGASALLIGGCTLHSYLGIGLGTGSADYLSDKISKSKWFRKRWIELDCLVVDEVSMLDPDLFDKLEYIARVVRGILVPFGGIQLILSGDFSQLPVVNSTKFCFEAKTWNQCITNIVYLTKIIRQKDIVFQECLNKIRMGNVDESVVSVLDTLVGKKLTNEFGIKPTRLFSKNIDVDRINDQELDKLAKTDIEFREYIMDIVTYVKPNDIVFTIEKFKKNCNAPEVLQLCIGAQVMLLKNLDLSMGLANGSRGVVVNFFEDIPLVKFINGCEMLIDYNIWNVEENGQEILRCQQIPLKIAYAVTIHKSQGTSLDYVEMDLATCFEYGQAYVALSRAKTLDGLSIINIDYDLIKAHPRAVEFYRNLETD